MNLLATSVFIFFAARISFEDIRYFKIRNRLLLPFFCCTLVFSAFSGSFRTHFLSGLVFLLLFSFMHIAGALLPRKASIGFGDVKLLAVLAFGYVDHGIRSTEVYLLSLWCALLLQLCLHFLHQGKLLPRIAMAPSIFLAGTLYLYAPIGLLLPQ